MAASAAFPFFFGSKTMPGNYGPPSMRLEEKRRTDSEIVWANGIGSRIGASSGFVIATMLNAAFIPQGFRSVGNVIGIGGAVFCVWMWSEIGAELRQLTADFGTTFGISVST